MCLPLRPTPAAPPPSQGTPDSATPPPPPPAKGLTLPAVPTPPTPLPLLPALSALFPSALAPAAPGVNGSGRAAGGGAVDTPTPQATIDALVTSLIPTLPAAGSAPAALPGSASSAPLDPSTSATSAASGAIPSAGGGKSALQDELRLAASSSASSLSRGDGARGAARAVGKAAVGACRSRGASGAETVFVVAYCVGGLPGSGAEAGAGAVASRRGSAVRGGEGDEGAAGKEDKDSKTATTATADNGGFDDDFAMLADFTSLDEAFGGGSAAADAPAAPGAGAETNGAAAGEEAQEDKEELEAWARALEREEADTPRGDKWRVELAEVRVEMAAMDGPRAFSLSRSPRCPASEVR